MKNGYWLYIDTYVHISAKKGDALFYNSYTGKILEYKDNETVFKLTRRLNSPRNRQVIHVTGEDMQVPEIQRFIADIREHFMGDIISTSLSKSKPFQATPQRIKIQQDIAHTKTDPSRSGGENIMAYLSDITIYLNQSCALNCDLCGVAYRQIRCCTARQSSKKYMSLETLTEIIQQIKGCSDINLHITGGNIFDVPYLDQFPTLPISLSPRSNFYIHYLNAAALSRNEIQFLGDDNFHINLLATFPVNAPKLETALKNCISSGRQTRIAFNIRDEEEYNQAEALSAEMSIENFTIIPVYDGKNLSFFEENIFIDYGDIHQNKPSLRDIYINSTVNSWNFGKISILPNGDIHADINAPKLGNISNSTLYDALVREMKHGKSWLKKRNNVRPCRDCNFEKLCPPISGYNMAIGKYNMCHICP